MHELAVVPQLFWTNRVTRPDSHRSASGGTMKNHRRPNLLERTIVLILLGIVMGGIGGAAVGFITDAHPSASTNREEGWRNEARRRSGASLRAQSRASVFSCRYLTITGV